MRMGLLLRGLIMACAVTGFLSGTVSGQDVRYTPVEKADIRSGDFGVAGKIDGRLWTWSRDDDGYALRSYSDSMTLIATVLLDFLPEKSSIVRVISLPDGLALVYDTRIKGKTYANAARLDRDGLLIGRPRTLEEKEGNWLLGDKDETACAVSDDHSRLLVYTAHSDRDGATLRGFLLDTAMNTLRKVGARTGDDEDMTTGDLVLGNDGTVYWQVAEVSGRYDYATRSRVVVIPPHDGPPVNIPIGSGSEYASAIILELDNRTNMLHAAGFYSPARTGNIEGAFHQTLSASSDSVLTTTRMPFTESLRNETGERSSRRALNNYLPRGLVIRNDGGFVLLAESYYVSTSNAATPFGYYGAYFGPFTGSSVREYHYGDILVMSATAEGKEDWHSFIRKEQYSQEDNGAFSSYGFMNAGGSLLFLYNDFDRSNSRIHLATIDGSGEVGRRELPMSGNAPDWLPRRGVQISARQIALPCITRRGLCFAKVVF